MTEQSERKSPSLAAATAIRPDEVSKVLVRHDVGVCVPMPLRLRPCDQRVLGHVHKSREAAVEQGHLDAGALSTVQRGEDPGAA